MKKIFRNYIVLSVMLILIALIVGNCGGGDDTGAVPDVSGNSTQTQNLVTKDVSGFVYATSSLSASKDGEEEETVFSILDIPLSGEEGFIAQVNEYIQEDTSSKGSSPETEELLVAFTEEAGQYQPLPVWNSAANIYSSYADSLSTSPVPITSEGEISGSVLVDASDDLVSLDIEVSGEECYETETISSSDLLNSSDTSGEYVLKSCPKKIIIKPGDCEIFSVFAKPSTNLSELGLQFSLVNPELGTVCGPIFLRCNGAKKYSVAYGLIYAKKNVETPVDTAINVSTTQGESLIIPVQIVKKTAVVSGTVYAGGPIVKGHVVSQGPKSQCKINTDGTYSLPKVWQGTGRKITATWWIMKGDKKVRYRETKYVDVFGDVTVNFGIQVTPTVPPLRPITDPYYTDEARYIMMQTKLWAENRGIEEAVQQSVAWLNGNLDIYPPPQDIAGAIVDDSDPTMMWISFTDGRSRCISFRPIVVGDTLNSQNLSKEQFDKETHNELKNIPTTVNSNKIVILAPFTWQLYSNMSVYGKIYEDLNATGVYDIKRKIVTTENDIEIIGDVKTGRLINDDTLYAAKMIWGEDSSKYSVIDRLYQAQIQLNQIFLFPSPEKCQEGLNKVAGVNEFDLEEDIKNFLWNNMEPRVVDTVEYVIKNRSNIIGVEDFKDLASYGIIYIATHGFDNMIACGPLYKDVATNFPDLYEMDPNDMYSKTSNLLGTWCFNEVEVIDRDKGESHLITVYCLTKNFFNRYPHDFSNSIIYLDACNSWTFINVSPFSSAKAYLGYTKPAANTWAREIAYYFFLYMIDGYTQPKDLFNWNERNYLADPTPLPQGPMSVQKAHETFSQVKETYTGKHKSANPDPKEYPDGDPCEPCNGCELKLGGQKLTEEDIYFPVPVNIIVHEE